MQFLNLKTLFKDQKPGPNNQDPVQRVSIKLTFFQTKENTVYRQ